jgi:uncharacterized protein
MLHNQKYQKLLHILRDYESVIVAFSGGVDSTLLLKAAIEAIGGKNVLAATFYSTIYSENELSEIKNLGSAFECRFMTIKDDTLLDHAGFRANPPNRCYICKRILFEKLLDLAERQGISTVADGSNVDDLRDYRPGMKAIRELNVISPLQDAELTKREIRLLSKELGLPTWNKPSSPCLCSRIPYGNEITEQKLRQIEAGEKFLREIGFPEARIRHHENLARIEVPADRITDIVNEPLLSRVKDYFREIGFQYVTLDLHGFRSGSLNEAL